MKYKMGKKGRKVKKLRKVWGRKTGSGKFSFSGKSSNWGNQSMVPASVVATANDRVKDNLRKIGFRIGGDK